jgi:oligopeptide transport system substrate-binding protein
MKRTLSHIARLVAGTLVAASAIAGPLTGAQPAHAQTRIKTMRLGINGPLAELDPAKVSMGQEWAVGNMVYEMLTRFDNNGRVQPGAAESWSSNAGLTEWVFNLRKGLTYSDKTVLNAKRFEYSLIRALDPATGAFTPGPTYIAGATEWADAAAALAEETDTTKLAPLKEAVAAAEKKTRASVRAFDSAGKPCTTYRQTDCLTLRISLEAPYNGAPYLMSFITFAPVKEEIVSRGPTWWKRAANWVGNGTHALRTFDGVGNMTLMPNGSYWRGTAKVGISIKATENSDMLVADYNRGQMDMLAMWAGAATPENLAALPAADLRNNPTNCSVALNFRSLNKPFDDPKVRQAFTAAMDPSKVSGGIIPDIQSAASWLPPLLPGAAKNGAPAAFSVDTARKLLSESTYKTDAALPALQVPFQEGNDADKAINEKLVALLKSTFPALKVELKPVAPQDFGKNVRGNEATEFDMWMVGWCGDRPDDFLGGYFTKGSRGWLHSRWSSQAFDDLATKMAAEPDEARRATMAKQLHDILVKEQPFAFLGYNTNRVYVKSNVLTGPGAGFDTWLGDFDRLLWDLK